MKDAAHSQLSHSAIDRCSKIPDQNMQSIQTPTNRNVVDPLRPTETSSSIRSSFSVETKSNNIAILGTFPEYRELKRNFERASKENEAWAEDYKKLTLRMKHLEQTTFRM